MIYNTKLGDIIELCIFNSFKNEGCIPSDIEYKDTKVYKDFYYEYEGTNKFMQQNYSSWLVIVYEWDKNSLTCFYNIVTNELEL